MSTENSLQTTLPLRPRGVAQEPVQPEKEQTIAAMWYDYFGKNDNDLAKWKQLCRDLGKPSESFTSKTQCRKALKGVWVNIHDFLAAENKPEDVVFYGSEKELSKYTLKSHKIFPRREISQDSPLRDLRARILYPRGGRKRGQT